MLESIYHRTLKSIKNHIFGVKKSKILPYFTQCYEGCNYITLLNLLNH